MRLIDHFVFGLLRDPQQLAGERDAGLTGGPGEKAVMPDAVEAFGQHMKQEAAKELVGGKPHDLLALGVGSAIILLADGDAVPVEGDEPTVRDRNPVCVARQIGQHGLGSGERRFCIDHPSLLPDGREVAQESAAIGELRQSAEEGEPASIVELDQPGQEQAAEQLAEHAHR